LVAEVAGEFPLDAEMLFAYPCREAAQSAVELLAGGRLLLPLVHHDGNMQVSVVTEGILELGQVIE